MTTITERTIKSPICRFDELEDGLSRGFDPLAEGRDTMFIVRRGDKLFAWRNNCPHYDFARMAWKRNEFLNGKRSMIMCAAHGALFDIKTGVCVSGPPLGERLQKVEVVLRDGFIFIQGAYAPGLRTKPGNQARFAIER